MALFVLERVLCRLVCLNGYHTRVDGLKACGFGVRGSGMNGLLLLSTARRHSQVSAIIK